jgi:thymidylate synthase ThyX
MPPMDKSSAIYQIRDVCNNISRELMRVHPAVPPLADKEAQDEIYKTVFELTKQVETIKKRLARLESKDGSSLL